MAAKCSWSLRVWRVSTRTRLHKATGFFWKADPVKQEEFIHTYEQQKHEAEGQKTRRYFVDACHPVWGVEMLYYCWLLVGQRFLVGVGGGRKRLNILGADARGPRASGHPVDRDNINGQQFVNFLRLLRASHPETEKFILYLTMRITTTPRWSRSG